MGGAGVSLATGAEAIYFNPAGIAGPSGGQISLNFSPTLSKYSGKIGISDVQRDSKTAFSPIFGFVASYGLTPQLGVGAGVYVSGGSKAIYENQDFTDLGAGLTVFNPTIQTQLTLVEYALGASYELMPHLKIGASWRILRVSATFGSVGFVPSATGKVGAIAASTIDDLSATRYNGFKLGAQWTSDDNSYGLGATWRTSVNFIAKGTSSGTLIAASGTSTPLTGTATEVSSTFPSQVTLGGYYDVLPKVLRVVPEYVWTEYAVNSELGISGSIVVPGAPAPSPYSNIKQGWKNQSNLRLGFEYLAMDPITIRAGYVFTSQVVPAERARATFSAPGAGHTITAGAGTSILDKTLDIDGAIEYSVASGSGATDDALKLPSGTVLATGSTGDFSTKAYALHTGVTYHF